MIKTPAKRGPKEIFEKSVKLRNALNAVKQSAEGEAMPSRFLLKRMEDRGMINFDIVPSGGRGRPAHQPRLTDFGAGCLNELQATA
jgi:hypothetical protein